MVWQRHAHLYLIEMLRKFHVLPSEVGHSMQAMASFDAPTERMTTITPLLYQSGYVTIKDYDKYTELYTLDIPNREIRVGLMQSLLPNYLAYNTDMGLTTIGRMYGAIRLGDMDGACVCFRSFSPPFLIAITRIMKGITSSCSTSSSLFSECMWMWKSVPRRDVWTW